MSMDGERSRELTVDGWELVLRARPVGEGFVPEVASRVPYEDAGRSFAEVFGFALGELYDPLPFYPDAEACLDAVEAEVRAALARRKGTWQHPGRHGRD